MYTQDEWRPGDTAWFEYHCWESDESSDADLWHRSHQLITVVHHDASDHDCLRPSTLAERGEAAQPCLYVIRFEDGHEAGVFEDEVLTSPEGYERADP